MCDAICNVHFLVWSEYLFDLDIFLSNKWFEFLYNFL